MGVLLDFVQAHRSYFDAAQAISSVLSLVGWIVGAVVLVLAWRRISRISVGPLTFEMLQEQAIVATAAAARNWQAGVPSQQVDVPRIRETVGRAFTPSVSDKLLGKSVLWVDDNPVNNELAVRALKKLGLDIEQATNTDAALAAMHRRYFDLVISDLGRGSDMQAGYDLLNRIRSSGSKVPFFIFAGSDSPEFRREAAERGAQLSTNDMLELVDCVIRQLGEKS